MAKPKILIVDPDEKNLRILAISLKKADLNVTVSTDGNDAISKVETLKPDIVISEIDLGSTDGFTLLQFIRRTSSLKDIPFVILTKNKNIDDKIKGLKLGANDYLTKPIYLKEIITRVKILLERVEREKVEIGVDKGFSGDLTNMGVVELIQVLELGNKTAIIRLKYKTHEGVVYFKKGRIVHAEVGKLKGEKAFYLILNWTEGTFHIEFTEHNVIETITTSNQGLLMEGLRRIDEWKQLQEIIPPLDTVLVIDSQAILNEHPEQFPSKVENILAEFDGKKSIIDVVESLDFDEIEALKIISQLYFQGFLVESSRPSQEKKITYYYPTKFAQNVEAHSKTEETKTWASEAEEFLSQSSGAGEDTTFLQPPVEEELKSQLTEPQTEEGPPASIEVEKPRPSENVIYLKSVQEQKLKPPSSTPLVPQNVSLSDIAKPQKIERQVVAISAGAQRKWTLSKIAYLAIGVVVITLPAIFYGVPGLKNKLFSSRAVVEAKGEDVQSLLAKAESLINVSKFEEAASIIANVIKKEQNNARAYYLYAIANLGIPGKSDLAIDALNTAIRLRPTEIKYRVELAGLFKEAGRFSDAERLLSDEPGLRKNKEALMMLASIQESQNKLSDAISTYREVIGLESDNIDVRLKVAKLSLERNEFQTVEEVLSGVRTEGVTESVAIEIAYLLGRAAEGLNKKAEAIEIYKKVLSKAGDYRDTRLRLNEIEKAVKPPPPVVQKQPKKAPSDTQYEAAMKKGREFYKKGEVEKAIEQFKLANRLKPQDDTALVELGTAFFDMGNDIDAILKLTQAITINPKNSQALLLLGNIYYARGDKDKAVNYYQRFLQISPDSPYASEVRTILGRLK